MPEPGPRHPRIVLLCATAGGLGWLRPAPGTWGSLGGLAVAAAILTAGWQPTWLLAGAALAATIVGIWASAGAARLLGREDPSQVVVDEVAGQLLAVAIIPPAVLVASPLPALTLAFLAFRCFDVLKPWPIRALERLPGGWGIMADDLAAGALAGLVATACLA